MVKSLGYELEFDNKRTAYVRIPGKDSSKTVCVGAHLDTIGLQVRHVMENGWIEVKNLDGVNFHNIEGENVYILLMCLMMREVVSVICLMKPSC